MEFRLFARLGARLRRGFSLRTEVLYAGGSVLVLTALSIAALTWAHVTSEQRTSELLRTRALIATAQGMARAAAGAQAALRGYALTHERALLRQYDAETDAFDRQLGRLAALTDGQPDRMRRVQEIHVLFDRWHDNLGNALVGSAISGDSALRSGAIGGSDQLYEVVSAIDKLIAIEADQLDAREQTAVTGGRAVVLGSLVGTALVVIIAVAGALAFAYRVTRDLAELQASAGAIAAGHLERRVPIRREDEIGALGDTFNAMVQQLDRRQREDAALNRMREMMQAAQSTLDAQQVVALLAPQCLPGTAGRLFLLNDTRNLLLAAGGWGEGLPEEPFAPDDCWSFRMGRVHAVNDPETDVPCAHARSLRLASMCLPLVGQGDTVGLLHVVHGGEVNPRLAREVGEILSLTLANLRLREALRNQATRDPLTGLFNRRYLEETFRREMARADRTRRPIGVVMLDIDHFKRFNDTYGHGAGDALLKEVADVLRTAFRAADVVCRYGGEEFVALLPDCDLREAVRRADAVRIAVSCLSVTHEGRVLGAITISAGVAVFPDHGADPDVLLQAADEALYRSKSEGRDRVTSAHEPRPVAAAHEA